MKLKFVLEHYSLHEYTDPFFSKVQITTSFFTCIENTAITVQVLHSHTFSSCTTDLLFYNNIELVYIGSNCIKEHFEKENPVAFLAFQSIWFFNTSLHFLAYL